MTQVRKKLEKKINYKIILRLLLITCLGSPPVKPSTSQGPPPTSPPPHPGCPRTSPSCFNPTTSPPNVTEVPRLKELSQKEVNKKFKKYKKIIKSKRKGGKLLSRSGGRSKDVSYVWVILTLNSGDQIQSINKTAQS